MGFIDFKNYIQELTTVEVYPYAVPDDVGADAITINLEPRYNSTKGGLYQCLLKVHTRSNHPANAEQQAMELMNHFRDKSGFYIGSEYVVLSQVNNRFPLFIDKDSLERYTYTFDVYLKIQI